MNYSGLILGLAAFLLIGSFHIIVIKSEYHFGVKCWPAFIIAGLASCVGSLCVNDVIASAILGILGFSCFWSTLELFKQRKRVAKGWFPKKPE